MKEFSFPGVGPIEFGAGLGATLPKLLENRFGTPEQVFLVTDPGVKKAGVLDPVLDSLRQANCEVTIYSEIQSNPSVDCVDGAANAVRCMGQPIVLGIGGGSALDVAKLAACMSVQTDSTIAYGLRVQPLPERTLKLVLLPTTAGTGSEVTRTAIFSDTVGKKLWCWGDSLLADLVVLDPSLTVALPRAITAATGVDAMVHAVEAITGQRRNPVTLAFASEAIRLVNRHMKTAMDSPEDLAARSGMLLGAMFAGLAIEQSGTGIAHAVGHGLSTLCGTHHGLSVGIGMYASLEWNAQGAEKSYQGIAELLGKTPTAKTAVETLKDFIRQSEIPLYWDSEIDPESLAEQMLMEENLPMIRNNARTVTPADALAVAIRALGRA